MEKLDYTALSKTYTIDFQIADSAATANALLSGHKTKYFTMGTSGDVQYDDCSSLSKEDAAKMHASVPKSGDRSSSESLLVKASKNGMATGLVTSTRLTHATPAAVYAHSPNRWWEKNAPDGCLDMAEQYVKRSHYFNLTFACGQGYFNKYRNDGRNLISEWLHEDPARQFYQTKRELLDADISLNTHHLGLFNDAHCTYKVDRDDKIEPSLTEMTTKAIDILEKSEKE